MAAPQWFEGKDSVVGKLFGDDFEAGNIKLTFKSVASNGLNIKVEGTQTSAGTVDGLLETKYTFSNGACRLAWRPLGVFLSAAPLPGPSRPGPLSPCFFFCLSCLPFSLTSPALTWRV
jgi:hypothetical protein